MSSTSSSIGMIVTDGGDVCQEKIGAKSRLSFNISEDRISRLKKGVSAQSWECSYKSLAFSVANWYNAA